MTEKIPLSKREKELFLSLINGNINEVYDHSIEDNRELFLLESKKLIKLSYMSGVMSGASVTKFGWEYFCFNPTLKNPSIWDDQKYVITTILSIFMLIATIVVGIRCS